MANKHGLKWSIVKKQAAARKLAKNKKKTIYQVFVGNENAQVRKNQSYKKRAHYYQNKQQWPKKKLPKQESRTTSWDGSHRRSRILSQGTEKEFHHQIKSWWERAGFLWYATSQIKPMQEKIVIVSGGFDPVHKGHVEHFQEAAAFGRVVLALNSDAWLELKKGKPFMTWDERKIILEEMESIWRVIGFEDDEWWTACNAIHKVKQMFPEAKLYFAKGGDRVMWGDHQVSAEEKLCKEIGVEMIFGIGKSGKIQSSSTLLSNWEEHEEKEKNKKQA